MQDFVPDACVWPAFIPFFPAADALDLTQLWLVKSPYEVLFYL